MTNICAAIGLAQLCRIEQILQRKRQLALMYGSLLPNTVVFQGCDQSCSHSQWMVSCRVPGISRDRVRKVLAEDGIETRPVFYPVNEMEMYQNGAHPTPVSAAISKQGLNLPSYPTIRDSEIEEICQKITEELLARDNDVA
jgi:perosamine synthetase